MTKLGIQYRPIEIIYKGRAVEVVEKWANKRDTLEVGITDAFFDSLEQGHGIHVIIGLDFLQDTDYELSFSSS